jgi:gliding motility-associated lipoprotein GldB
MKHLWQNWLVLIVLPLGLFSQCTSEEEQIPDVSYISIDLRIESLEDALFKISSREELQEFVSAHPQIADTYFHRPRFPNDSLFIEQLWKFRNEPVNDTLYHDVKSIFGEEQINKLENELTQAFRFVKHYFPDFRIPKVYTMISGFGSFGFGQDMLVSEELIVIGLDYYAGDQGMYHPSDIPLYIQDRYQPENIVTHLITFLSSQFNAYEAKDKTMLADMTFYGKAYFFTQKILPHSADSTIIGYTAAELADCQYNSQAIWAHFIENDLFYEKGNFVKNKYVGEAPKVSAISDDCPGRVGRWLGWQIVQAFWEEHPQTTLPSLMSVSDAQQIFQKSKYRPESP